jgi:hypothetical protein
MSFGIEASTCGAHLPMERLPESGEYTLHSLHPAHRCGWLIVVHRLAGPVRRRTRVARLFPNEAPCLRLVSAILMEISEDWQTAERRYLTFQNQDAFRRKPNLQNECCLIPGFS